VLIRHLWQLKTVVFLHWCLIKVAGVKVYPRQTCNFRFHAVSACSNHVIGLWCHRPMHALTACIAPWHHRLILHGFFCFDSISDIPLLQLLWCLIHTFLLISMSKSNVCCKKDRNISCQNLATSQTWTFISDQPPGDEWRRKNRQWPHWHLHSDPAREFHRLNSIQNSSFYFNFILGIFQIYGTEACAIKFFTDVIIKFSIRLVFVNSKEINTKDRCVAIDIRE
jgi:hypothetical protein